MSVIIDKTVIVTGGAGSGKKFEIQNCINDALASEHYVYLFYANGAVYGDYRFYIESLNGMVLKAVCDIKKDSAAFEDAHFVAFDMSHCNYNIGNYLLELCVLLQEKHKKSNTKALVVIEEFWQYSGKFSHSKSTLIDEIDALKGDYLNFILSTQNLADIDILKEKQNDFFIVNKVKLSHRFVSPKIIDYLVTRYPNLNTKRSGRLFK
jgi:hypothetical protein